MQILAPLLLSLFALAFPANAYMQETGNPKWLRWASDPESGAPFVFYTPNDHKAIKGLDAELVEALVPRMGYQKAAFYKNDWDGLVPGLQRGLYDIVVDGIEITPEHQGVVEISKPYYITQLQLVIRADNEHIHQFKDCTGKVVGTLKSSTGFNLLKKLKDVDIRTYTDEVHAYTDLKLGRIDAALFDAPIALYYGGWDPAFKFIDEPIGKLRYGILVPKGNQALLEKVNAALDALMQSGELRKILENWNLWNNHMAEYLNDHQPCQSDHLAYKAFVENIQKIPSWREYCRRYLDFMPSFARAAWMTMGISLSAMFIAIVLGFVVATIRLYSPRFISILATLYVEVVRGTPLMIQLLLIFYGLPLLHIKLSPIFAGILGLGINYSAYEAENYRAGLSAVPKGQMEAALALGMTPIQSLIHVIMPQAFRFVLPPVTNDFISLLKDSSLVSLITITELTKAYTQLATTYYDYLGTGLLVAAIYLLLGLPFVRLARWLEKRLSFTKRRSARAKSRHPSIC